MWMSGCDSAAGISDDSVIRAPFRPGHCFADSPSPPRMGGETAPSAVYACRRLDGTDRAFFRPRRPKRGRARNGRKGAAVNNIFYIIGVVVVVLVILGYFGFR